MDEIQKIKAAIAGGITKKDIAARAEMARGVLDGIDTDDFNPTIKTVRRLSAAAEALARERIAALKQRRG